MYPCSYKLKTRDSPSVGSEGGQSPSFNDMFRCGVRHRDFQRRQALDCRRQVMKGIKLDVFIHKEGRFDVP